MYAVGFDKEEEGVENKMISMVLLVHRESDIISGVNFDTCSDLFRSKS